MRREAGDLWWENCAFVSRTLQVSQWRVKRCMTSCDFRSSDREQPKQTEKSDMAVRYPANKDPFLEDDDEFSFASKSRQGGAYGGTSSGYGGWNETEDDYTQPKTQGEQLQELKENSMNRQLASAQRAVAAIYDSERVGIATAEELSRQGEQLDNIERKTTEINADMKTTQRHLNSIKSVFGGIRNWWSGKPEEKDKSKDVPPVSSRPENTRLKEALDKAERHPDVHPAMRFRGEDVSGFYDDEDLDAKFMQGSQGSRGQSGYSSDSANRSQLYGSQSRPAQKVSGFQEYDEKLDGHLDVMSDGMARLKMLASGLGDEIQAQNDQIDNRILPNTERADQNIRDQNRQMKRILGHKK